LSAGDVTIESFPAVVSGDMAAGGAGITGRAEGKLEGTGVTDEVVAAGDVSTIGVGVNTVEGAGEAAGVGVCVDTGVGVGVGVAAVAWPIKE